MPLVVTAAPGELAEALGAGDITPFLGRCTLPTDILVGSEA